MKYGYGLLGAKESMSVSRFIVKLWNIPGAACTKAANKTRVIKDNFMLLGSEKNSEEVVE